MAKITVIIPTSPIKSHPDTSILEESIATVRHHLPDSEILLTFDGVHPSQEHFTERYNEFKNRMLWKCLHKYTNVIPFVFEEHQHQSGMLHQVINEVKTDLILYVEGDTMLVTERTIDWEKCIDWIMSGEAQTIRFHFEEVIPHEHENLMLGNPKNEFQKTIQWSQRPHLSSKLYYEDLLKYFPIDSKTFIEDEWHGVVMNDYCDNGMLGWYKHRLWIYSPKDGKLKRSYTLDGRQGEPKVGEGFQK
jgi:hypothetical protein